LPHVAYEVQPVKARRPNLYRLIIKKENKSLALNQVNTPEGDYDMNDLLERVPCKPGRECYILRGRIDDVIVHSTGEKTSPAPIEAAVLANCHAAKSALVVGQDQFNTALLVELQQGLEPDDAGVMDEVWKAVQVANQSAPQHSRLVRQMIALMKNGEAGGIPRTEKGSIRRKLANERFQN
jgi:ribosome biogenesis protein SSF1/2